MEREIVNKWRRKKHTKGLCGCVCSCERRGKNRRQSGWRLQSYLYKCSDLVHFTLTSLSKRISLYRSHSAVPNRGNWFQWTRNGGKLNLLLPWPKTKGIHVNAAQADLSERGSEASLAARLLEQPGLRAARWRPNSPLAPPHSSSQCVRFQMHKNVGYGGIKAPRFGCIHEIFVVGDVALFCTVAAVPTQLNQQWGYYFWLMAEGEELRQIHLRSICSLLITTDAITTKTSFQMALCVFNPSSTKGLCAAARLKRQLGQTCVCFFFLNGGRRLSMSGAWDWCWCLAPWCHTLLYSTNGFNPHKLEEVAQ